MVNMPLLGVRAAQGHVVEGGDQHAMVDQIKMNGLLERIIKGRFRFCAIARRLWAELKL